MRYLTGGESHGPCLTAIIEGLPSGLNINSSYINNQLVRRQQGYGRGGRMKVESDQVEFLAGLRFNQTTGSPLVMQVKNKDAENWNSIMAAEGDEPEGLDRVTSPRPGHADYAGGVKYKRKDLRDILERSSARETAMRVVVGSVARRLLEELGIHIYSHVIGIGSVYLTEEYNYDQIQSEILEPHNYEQVEKSPLRCLESQTEEKMKEEIDVAKQEGDTLGGVWEILVTGLPVGLGSHSHSDRKLDGRLAGALMSLQGIKGVEIGLGFQAAQEPGSKVHDAFYLNAETGMPYRSSNRAGGLEGGITNGETLVLRAAMKPIPTLLNPLPSVDLVTGKESKAAVERSDVCAVPAASVVGEAIAAWELALAVREKFGGDSLSEMIANYQMFLQSTQKYPFSD